jgi:hypothetical protein
MSAEADHGVGLLLMSNDDVWFCEVNVTQGKS